MQVDPHRDWTQIIGEERVCLPLFSVIIFTTPYLYFSIPLLLLFSYYAQMKQVSYQSQARAERKHLSHQQKTLKLFFSRLSLKWTDIFSSDITDATIAAKVTPWGAGRHI